MSYIFSVNIIINCFTSNSCIKIWICNYKFNFISLLKSWSTFSIERISISCVNVKCFWRLHYFFYSVFILQVRWVEICFQRTDISNFNSCQIRKGFIRCCWFHCDWNSCNLPLIFTIYISWYSEHYIFKVSIFIECSCCKCWTCNSL